MYRKLFPLAILMLWVFSLNGCSRTSVGIEEKKPEAKPLAIESAEASLRQIDEVITITGSLFPDETVTLSSEVAGRLAGVTADFGDFVRKGQVVAELDTRELSLQLEKIRASLAQAVARIGLSPGQEDLVPESTAAIRQASAQLDDARFKYENAARLAKSGDISPERHVELEKAYQIRQAALDAAHDDLRFQLASIQALKADVRLAEKRLKDATVTAPFDGVISARLVSPGQYLRDNTAIMTLVKTRPLRLRLDIPENESQRVRPGTTLTFTADTAPGVAFHATVQEINPGLESRSRSLSAEARLTEEDSCLRPGMFVQVHLVTDKSVPVLTVPRKALYTIAGLNKIFVVRDGKAVELKIILHRQGNDWIEVPADQLRAGEKVAVSHLDVLIHGSLVVST